MPGTSVDVGHGTTVTFGTSGFTAELTALRLQGLARRALDASHLSTAAAAAHRFGTRPYARGRLVNPGQLRMTLHFNPQTNPPLGSAPETLTITWPVAPGEVFAALWSATGFLTTLAITDSLDEVMVGQVTVQLTGEITKRQSGSFPLDELPGATGAWSTRKLSSTYTGACLRVRRSSDDTEQDIGFVGASLDTAALLAFVGAGNGFVTIWYDQSGAGINRDFVQTTHALQPRLVTSGAVLTTVGGQPSLVCDGVATTMALGSLASVFLTVSAGTVLMVFEATAINTATSPAYDNDAVWCNGSDQVGAHLSSSGPIVQAINQDSGGLDVATATIALSTSYVHVWRHGSGQVESYLNSNTATQATASGNTTALNSNLRIGVNYAITAYFAGGLAELIAYNTALSAADLDTVGASMAQPYGITWS